MNVIAQSEVERNTVRAWFGLTWLRLLVVAGLLCSIATTVAAIYLTDIEGGVVALAFAGSTWLVYSGRRRTGAILLLVVAAVTSFFMTAAALVNFRGFGGTEGLLISGVLAGISNLALLAAIGFLVRGDRQSFGPWAVVAAVAVSLVQPLFGAELDRSGEPSRSDLSLVAENVAFSHDELVAGAGNLTVSLENRDLFWHTFTIEELGVDLRVPVGAEIAATFDAPAGEYEFICAIPGHPEAGMTGTLMVTDS